jgi:hypothetical protein
MRTEAEYLTSKKFNAAMRDPMSAKQRDRTVVVNWTSLLSHPPIHRLEGVSTSNEANNPRINSTLHQPSLSNAAAAASAVAAIDKSSNEQANKEHKGGPCRPRRGGSRWKQRRSLRGQRKGEQEERCKRATKSKATKRTKADAKANNDDVDDSEDEPKRKKKTTIAAAVSKQKKKKGKGNESDYEDNDVDGAGDTDDYNNDNNNNKSSNSKETKKKSKKTEVEERERAGRSRRVVQEDNASSQCRYTTFETSRSETFAVWKWASRKWNSRQVASPQTLSWAWLYR